MRLRLPRCRRVAANGQPGLRHTVAGPRGAERWLAVHHGGRAERGADFLRVLRFVVPVEMHVDNCMMKSFCSKNLLLIFWIFSTSCWSCCCSWANFWSAPWRLCSAAVWPRFWRPSCATASSSITMPRIGVAWGRRRWPAFGMRYRRM